MLRMACCLPKTGNYIIYMDNYFTNVALFTALRSKGMRSWFLQPRRAQILTVYFISSKASENGDILAAIWQDSNIYKLRHRPGPTSTAALLMKARTYTSDLLCYNLFALSGPVKCAFVLPIFLEENLAVILLCP